MAEYFFSENLFFNRKLSFFAENETNEHKTGTRRFHHRSLLSGKLARNSLMAGQPEKFMSRTLKQVLINLNQK